MNGFILLAQGASDFHATIGPGWLPMLIYPMWFIAGLAVVAGAYFFLKKRYSKEGQAAIKATPRALRRVWVNFLRQIPPEFRRYVNHFQHFIVLGESASGKSLIISKFTDWKGQAAQFYPSYALDPQLQCYMGTRSVIQEVPATLLADTSPKARKALLKLWGSLYGKREPIAIVTLSAAALRSATAETLRTQAQTMRGKLNVLSWACGKRIKARIVLSHMDQVEGYTAFSEFVQKQEIPHEIKVDPKAPDGGLQSCLDPLEPFLPIALTTLPARSYLNVLTFFNKAPATFENLGLIIRTLREPDPRSFEPEISELYLTSDASGSPSAISNPFATSLLAHTLEIERAIKTRHKRVAASAACAVLAYCAGSFFYEQSHRSMAKEAIARFATDPNSLDAAAKAEDQLNEFAREEGSFKSYLLPRWFPDAPNELREKFVKTIRNGYIMDRLEHAKGTADAHETALYAYGLLYACHPVEDEMTVGGKLASLITSKLPQSDETKVGEWSKVLNIPSPIIEAYIRQSAHSHPEIVAASELKLPKEQRASEISRGEWIGFLNDVRAAYQDSLTPEQLARFKARADSLRSGIAWAKQSQTTLDVFELLVRLGHVFEPNRDEFETYLRGLFVPDWLTRQFPAFEELLDLIQSPNSTIALTVRPEALNLSDFVNTAVAIQREQPPKAHPIHIAMGTPGSDDYDFEVQVWAHRLQVGRLRLLATSFIQANEGTGATILLRNAPSRAATHMRPPGNSDFLFPGDGSVSGNYTRSAWDGVRQQLVDFERAMGTQSWDVNDRHVVHPEFEKEVREALSKMVIAAAEHYAQSYANEWTRYFLAWHVAGDKLASLHIILGQMKLPVSRFQDFLQTVSDNTNTDKSIGVITTSSYQKPMYDKLVPFGPIDGILSATGQSFSELEKYRSILGRCLDELEEEPPPESKEAPEQMRREPLEFDKLQTPAGRLSYAILAERRDSYMKEVEAWLKANGITGDWQRPFIEPIQQLHVLGLADLEAAVQKNWRRRVRPVARILADKFPFNREASKDATPVELEEILLPGRGLFWVAFNNLIAPVCVQDAATGEWKPMRGTERWQWPADTFTVVNNLGRLTRTLYDKDGVARPFVFEVRPEPLSPPTAPKKPAVVLSFLTSGTNSVFGFNQKPEWQKLTVEWAKRPAAQVGLQVGDPESGQKSSRAVSEPDSAWAFYHLLTRDPDHNQNLWNWSLSGGVAGEYPIPYARFAFKVDPWELFNVPTLIEKEKEEPHESK